MKWFGNWNEFPKPFIDDYSNGIYKDEKNKVSTTRNNLHNGFEDFSKDNGNPKWKLPL